MKLYFKNSYSICKNFHREIESLKSIFKHNSYPHNLECAIYPKRF